MMDFKNLNLDRTSHYGFRIGDIVEEDSPTRFSGKVYAVDSDSDEIIYVEVSYGMIYTCMAKYLKVIKEVEK